ncbi:hypothetical protein [Geobacillus sp. YF-1]|uniref:hypothetical protein n=1 Tax=Geobacillus sp. YF-1 TaxID=3457480 RepID=UPI0040459623
MRLKGSKSSEPSAALFGETREMILQHIADASVVDEKLAGGIKPLQPREKDETIADSHIVERRERHG